jgi:hypothetical protein
MRAADASAEIDRLSAGLARETDGSKVLAIEAHAASIIGNCGRTCLSGSLAAVHSASGLTADGGLAGPISG